jgi:hypothetical protein
MSVGRLPWRKDHHRICRSLLYHRLLIGVACEDLPEEHNRVTLDPVLKDSDGIAAPRIDYAISENKLRDRVDTYALRGIAENGELPSSRDLGTHRKQHHAAFISSRTGRVRRNATAIRERRVFSADFSYWQIVLQMVFLRHGTQILRAVGVATE